MELNKKLDQPVRGRVLARVLAQDLNDITGGLAPQGGTCMLTCYDGCNSLDITNICGEDGD
jgi:hypothetical protein